MDVLRNFSDEISTPPVSTTSTPQLPAQVDSLRSFLTVFLLWLAIVISCTTCFRSLVKTLLCDFPNALCQKFCRSDPNQVSSRGASNSLPRPTTRLCVADDVIYITQPMEIRFIHDLNEYDDLEDQTRLDEPPDYGVALRMPKPRNNDHIVLDISDISESSSSSGDHDVSGETETREHSESQHLTSRDCTVSCDQTDESPPPSYCDVMNI